MAQRAGIPASSISYYESGERLPSREAIRAIAEALDIDPSVMCWFAYAIRDVSPDREALFRMVENLMESQLEAAIRKHVPSTKSATDK